MARRLDGGLPAESSDRSIRRLVGSRLQARRSHLGFGIDGIAKKLGILPSVYAAYETGDDEVPAWLLSRIADLYGVPADSFLQSQPSGNEEAEGGAAVGDCGLSPTYRVATVEERLGFLADTFSELDLEGQQQLLATASVLCRAKRSRAAGAFQRNDAATPADRSNGDAQRISNMQNSSRKSK